MSSDPFARFHKCSQEITVHETEVSLSFQYSLGHFEIYSSQSFWALYITPMHGILLTFKVIKKTLNPDWKPLSISTTSLTSAGFVDGIS